ncbi:MAG: hypothetical protein NZ891_06565 [bacterium]|nr:hypothetical protein [bacterium]MDW8164387.1 hypothetical protein [Candidatus Omnitrophota bacterium]
MKIENEELKEIIDLWDLKKEVKRKIYKLLDKNPSLSPTFLFRYYVPEGKKIRFLNLKKIFQKSLMLNMLLL